MTVEERFEAHMKNYEETRLHNEEMKNQNAYLRRQLGEAMKQRRKNIGSSSSSSSSGSVREEDEGRNPFGSSSEEEPMKRSGRGRRNQTNLNDIRVEVMEFKGRSGFDEFLDW